MMAGELQALTPVRRSFRILMPALSLIVCAGTTVGVIASPAVVRRIYGDADYSVIADEIRVREYLRGFFDAEIPRLFWERHSEWHRRGRSRSRREPFRDFVNDEYLRVLRAGPPSRGREFCGPDLGVPASSSPQSVR